MNTEGDYVAGAMRQQVMVRYIKSIGESFISALEEAFGKGAADGRWPSREAAIAATKMEEAVMWAVKGILKPK